MVTGLRVAFFGTPDFAVPSLAALHASPHDVVGVVTQPDRPRGRGQKLTPGPVKQFAATAGMPIEQPPRLRDEAFLARFDAWRLDLAVVAAYGKILPERLLQIPRLGMVNVHASLLPRWRGAAPIHRAVMAGDRETGVTIMRVVPALDAGPMLAKVTIEIGPNETSADLEPRLATAGAALLVTILDRLAKGPLDGEAQDERLVTYAARIDRAEAVVDWTRTASAIHNQIRGLQPWPLAAVGLHGRRVLLLASEVVSSDATTGEAGSVLSADGSGLVVATGAGTLRILRVQPEGRAVMSVRDFLNGHPVTAGDHLEPLPSRS